MFSMILFLVWFQRVFERRYFLSTYSLVSKDCALLLKTWIEDPFDIQNLSFTHDTTKNFNLKFHWITNVLVATFLID